MNNEQNKIKISISENEYLEAVQSSDPNYPGIWIELKKSNNDSQPLILLEKNKESGELRLLIWEDKENEDYTKKIIF